MYAHQGMRCAICRVASGRHRRLAVDHCHKTGRIRGLLCGRCNKMLGQARDSVEFFARAIDYLTEPPAFGVIGERQVPDVGQPSGHGSVVVVRLPDVSARPGEQGFEAEA